MSGETLPPTEYYDEFPQMENGIGLVRDFLTTLENDKKEFPTHLDEPREITIVTGVGAAVVLGEHLIPSLKAIGNLDVKLNVVKNEFLGESVTVAGLLSGQDIIKSLQADPPIGEVFLPPRVLNTDGYLLDNIRPEDISRVITSPVRVFNDDFQTLFF